MCNRCCSRTVATARRVFGAPGAEPCTRTRDSYPSARWTRLAECQSDRRVRRRATTRAEEEAFARLGARALPAQLAGRRAALRRDRQRAQGGVLLEARGRPLRRSVFLNSDSLMRPRRTVLGCADRCGYC